MLLVNSDELENDHIAKCLEELGIHNLLIAKSFKDTKRILGNEHLDIVLYKLEPNIKKIDLETIHFVRKKINIPIILLTESSNHEIADLVKEIKPIGYLSKPFLKEDLEVIIEVAICNSVHEENKLIEHIIVKDGYNLVKIHIEKVKYITSEQNYISFHLEDNKKVLARSTIYEILDRVEMYDFFRINRSTIVNVKYVSRIESDNLYIEDAAFNLTKTHRHKILSWFN